MKKDLLNKIITSFNNRTPLRPMVWNFTRQISPRKVKKYLLISVRDQFRIHDLCRKQRQGTIE